MSGRLWMFEEREYADEGAQRFTVSWHTLKVRAKALDPDDVDWDRDLEENYESHTTMTAALEHAKSVAPGSFFGLATVQQERADRYEDAPQPNIGEWVDVGDAQEISE